MNHYSKKMPGVGAPPMGMSMPVGQIPPQVMMQHKMQPQLPYETRLAQPMSSGNAGFMPFPTTNLSPIPQSLQNNPSMLADRDLRQGHSIAVPSGSSSGSFVPQIIANPNTFGYFITTDSNTGNAILPILPRF